MGNNEYYRYGHRERRTYAEILHDFSTTKIPLVIELSKLREFSISNSNLMCKDQVHLTMGVLRYKTIGHKRDKEGVCSSYIADLSPEDEPIVQGYIKHGTFPVPKEITTPLILVAAGTGIAPFRNIIQDRVYRLQHTEDYKSEDPNLILFYGSRNSTDDDYYSAEFESYEPYLKVIKAYSRTTDSKVYVQHKIREHKEMVKNYLIEKEAKVFAAGYSKFMPKSVEKALIEVISDVDNLDHKKFIKSRFTVEAW